MIRADAVPRSVAAVKFAASMVRTRLILVLALLVAISLASGFVALSQNTKVQHNLDQIVRQHNARLSQLHGMAEAVHIESRVVRTLILLHDKAEVTSQSLTIAPTRQRYENAWGALQALRAGAPGGQAEPSDILAASQRARPFIARVLELARNRQQIEATALLLAQADPAIQAWQEAIVAAFKREEDDNARDYAAAVSNQAQARALLIAVNGLNLTLGLAFGWLMIRQRRQDRVSKRALRQAKDAAEQALRAKGVFLANMSHEIRTPMNGVLGIAEMLAGTPLDETQRKYVKTIRQSGRSLMALLNDILDLSKVEAGRLELEHRPVELRRVLQASVDLLVPRASQKGLLLSLDIADDMDTWVHADPLRLQQVINNLLSNAVKFTERGQVRLSLQPEPALGAGGCRFSVIDTGPGIAAPAIDKLFQPFAQADGSTTRKYGGTGLGLAIASRIVEAMGSTLTVASTPGEGSTFGFAVRLPSAPRHLQHLDNEESGFSGFVELEPAGPDAALTVLVVEDNPVNQLYCQAVLEQLGHEVHLANDGLAAVQMAAARRYDLILMDCHMPVLDGFEATRRIRQQARASGAPQPAIVALTATAMAEDRLRCRDAGMDDLLAKPFTREEMAQLLGRAVATP
jgi:signal transduction histidine kinase/ActR/RegA family two-component response regulator